MGICLRTTRTITIKVTCNGMDWIVIFMGFLRTFVGLVRVWRFCGCARMDGFGGDGWGRVGGRGG